MIDIDGRHGQPPGILLRKILDHRSQTFTRAAPLRMKIDQNRH